MTLQSINTNLVSLATVHSQDSGSIQKGVREFGQFMCEISEQSKNALAVLILAGVEKTNSLIYVKTNSAADLLAEKLNRAGVVAESIHENKSQRTKTRTLDNFRKRSTNVLVATESAASVVDAEVLTIINYDLPVSAETYRKRVSFHSEAGVLQKVFSFCDKSENDRLLNIHRAFPGKIEMLQHDLV
jgi:ATP-dependent RNA helicase RhlE